MRVFVPFFASALVALSASAHAAIFTFNTDPFAGQAGQDALNTPGRTILGGEPSITFSIASDVFALDQAVFAVGNQVQFINSLTGDLPASGLNIIVVQDSAPLPFNAGRAADLIAEEITTDGAGFFVYFNSGLDAARLVYSTNLNDNAADLKVLARMTNLDDPSVMPDFTEANFTILPVPEPSGLLVLATAGMLLGLTRRQRRTA